MRKGKASTGTNPCWLFFLKTKETNRTGQSKQDVGICARSFAHGAKSLCTNTKMDIATDLALHFSFFTGSVQLVAKDCAAQLAAVGLIDKKISDTHVYSPFMFWPDILCTKVPYQLFVYMH